MIAVMTKDQIQQEANEALDRNGGSGLLVMATGSGKSKIAIERADKLIKENSYNDILLVVPTEKLRDEGWADEFKKWGFMDSWQFITRVCYASLNTYKSNVPYDLVILDEAHNITEANSVFFDNNQVKNVIGLTATEPDKYRDKIKLDLLHKYGLDKVYELTLDKAVELGIVAPYDITIVTVELNGIDKYIKAGNKNNVFYTTEEKQYEYLNRICLANPAKFNILKRMRFIYNLKSKTEVAKKILDNVIPNTFETKTLIFCGSIDQAEEICPITFHSKTNDILFNSFKEGRTNRLSCVNALDEGHNIPDLDCGFIIQLNSNPLRLVQRIGRHIRYRDGHTGKIIILCVKDTVDEDWVKKAIKGLDNTKIKWMTIDDLRLGRKTINFN